MSSDVPYLAISEFERQGSEILLKHLQNDECQLTPETVKRKETLRHSMLQDGYSHYVELILQGMGMQKYCSLFEEEDISIDMLVSMQYDDLLNLGITDSTDRQCIWEHLKQFRVENNILIQCGQESSIDDRDQMGDNIKMIRNVYRHLVELNSNLAYLHFKMSENLPTDYLICDSETGLNFLKFTVKHAAIQSNRISQLLFDGKLNGSNLISDIVRANGGNLPQDMKEKLIGCHKNAKKLKKCRLTTTVLLGIGIMVVAVMITSKKAHPL